MEDPRRLTDKDGHQWAGVILDSDYVQKTTAGGRVGSYRALVMVGNLQGTGGFGVGKSKTVPDAINSAFRDALRQLIHVDLYDNSGLAHDLHGKHNGCHAYIRATPTTREMVGSSFSTSILQRFGVSSASVKVLGRRNPYAQVRAIFDALEGHENIDEYARDRGKRYITLRWAQDNGV
jgi:small subunit ribosomal protein S5